MKLNEDHQCDNINSVNTLSTVYKIFVLSKLDLSSEFCIKTEQTPFPLI